MRALIAALLLAVAASAAACGGEGSAQVQPTGGGMIAPDPPLRVGDVGLPDVAQSPSAPFAFRAEPGGLLLVFFGFTTCPDICPTTLAGIRSTLAALPGDDRARVRPAFVTVDPTRDTPEVLRGYVGRFFTSYHALRSPDQGALAAAEAAFGAGHQIDGDIASGTYTVTHTAAVFGVDAAGLVQAIWPYGTTPEAMASDLRGLLDAGGPA